jgi:purine-nucleoside/S-methyl-5'-thioadenosine phosphorylase / adenosine deaminase
VNSDGNEIFPVLSPDWPLPPGVRCAITTRPVNPYKDKLDHEYLLGISPWAENDAAQHSSISDSSKRDRSKCDSSKSDNVQTARALLARQLGLKIEPQWLKQEHGVTVVEASERGMTQVADASFTRNRGLACAVLTADCLPILVSAKDGSIVAAIHAGWRGLSRGVIASTLREMWADPRELTVYLGPAISQQHFEVGPEVRQAFLTACEDSSPNKGLIRSDSMMVAECFKTSGLTEGHYFADLYELARIQLKCLGITDIFGGEYCTYAQASMFYSHRLDQDEGRMASLIWIA